MNKEFKIKPITVILENNGMVCGFLLKRDLTIEETRYIVGEILRIDVFNLSDFDYGDVDDPEQVEANLDEFNCYNDELCSHVNSWLRGECGDDIITDYACDCSDAPLGIFNLLPIIEYLQKINVI